MTDTPAEFPPPTIPTVYVDGVRNLAHTLYTAKFYLYRDDPILDANRADHLSQPVAQVVMPMPSFVAMALFFSDALDRLVREGRVNQSDIDAFKASVKPMADEAG
jgi:hypothetical protein